MNRIPQEAVKAIVLVLGQYLLLSCDIRLGDVYGYVIGSTLPVELLQQAVHGLAICANLLLVEAARGTVHGSDGRLELRDVI